MDRADWVDPPSEAYQAEHPDWNERIQEPDAEPDATIASVIAQLSWSTWSRLDIPKQNRLLGELIVPASKTFLIGTTGVGKTLFGYEWVGAMCSGSHFLHWTCDRPSKWLVLDGEMPDSLIKKRIADVLARYRIPEENATLYSLGRAEQIKQSVPSLSEMPPLNTEDGHKWVMRLATLLKVDGVLFDNLMSLSPGDHSKPDPWLQTLPLIASLANANLAQIWCDHTGWDASRQYGTSTKAWRFDSAGIMKPIENDQRQPDALTFNLTFDPPGKCRRKTPDNWRDFASKRITLRNGAWTAEDAAEAEKLSPKAKGWLDDITAIFAIPGVAENRMVNVNGASHVRFSISRDQLREWLRKCGRIGDGSHANLTDADRSQLRHWVNTLRNAGKIGVDGDYIWLA